MFRVYADDETAGQSLVGLRGKTKRARAREERKISLPIGKSSHVCACGRTGHLPNKREIGSM